MRRVRDLQAVGRAPPGFTQPIYPQGDPRAPYIFDLVRRTGRQLRRLDMVLAFLDEAGSFFHLQMAGAMITMFPIIVLYFFTQQQFIDGIATTGLKG